MVLHLMRYELEFLQINKYISFYIKVYVLKPSAKFDPAAGNIARLNRVAD
jgi:hypothetical protein